MDTKFKKHDTYFAAAIALTLLTLIMIIFLPGKDAGLTALAAETGSISGQSLSVDPTGQGEGYSAVLYDNTNGLPTSEANAIVETKEGFLWIGSYSGLIRYDGNTFERYDSSTGIASVVSLFVDSKNRLWVGTNDSGAAVMENGNFRMYNKEDGLKSLSVRSITEDNEGNIYLATTQGLAFVDEDMDLHLMDIFPNNEEYVRELQVGSDNSIYGITMDGSIFSIKAQKLIEYYDAEEHGVPDAHTILPDPQNPGYVYIGTMGSELYYGKLKNGSKNMKKMDCEPLNYINAIYSIDRMVWLCTDTGIGFLQNGKVTTIQNVPMTTSVVNMAVDYQGNPWFVSTQQGVMKIVPNQFTDIYEKYQLEDEVIYTTCMYEGQLFIGTKNSGLVILKDGTTVDKMPIQKSVSASGKTFGDKDLLQMFRACRIRSIIRDSQDRLWFSTFDSQGLVRYDHGKVTKFTLADGMPSERVRTVYECRDGSFIVCCTGGLAVIKDDKIVKTYGEEEGIRNIEVLTAAQMDNGDFVIGTDGGGIYIISPDGISHLGVEEGLSSDVILRVKKDLSRNILWVITSNAIGYLTSDYQITMIKKFPYPNNFDLYENSKGDMWILSSNGIYVANVEQLLKNQRITPLFYGMDNGLQCITTANSYSELTSDGNLYISGTTGVAKVNIEQTFEDVNAIKIAMPFVEADGKYIYPNASGTFVIPSDAKKLTIYSYVYNYSLMNPQVTYWLDGFEENTSTVKRSELMPIHYTNLKGGKYHFIMQIQDPQGQSSKEQKITILKQKAIYELLWVKILCGILIALVICIIVRLYIHEKTRRFLKRENEQKQLIREIVEAFAKVIDMKDKYTNGHSTRVAEYTAMLAKELGYDEDTVETYYNIALLHDIGKVGIPPEVLNKPGKLTDEEFQIIKSHPTLGYDTLKNISIMPELAIGAGSHHERPDGKGYPRGLKGDDIPRVAQIIAVADTFDAMYSNRPYRKRMNFEKVVSILKDVRGTQLTEDVVDAFLRLVEKGEFRAPDDKGGGSTEDIDNIHKSYESEKNK